MQRLAIQFVEMHCTRTHISINFYLTGKSIKKVIKTKTMYKLQHRVKLPDGRLKYIICRHINITVQIIYFYALILSMSVIYNCKKFPFQRYLLHIVEYVSRTWCLQISIS